MFTLNQALEVIKDKPEFCHKQRDKFSVIDYYITLENTFVGKTPQETKILENLRGTCFDNKGKIIRLGYHKFMNLNQGPDYSPDKFDFAEDHVIEKKLDGSAIFPIKLESGFVLGTRAGVTDVSEKATKFLKSMPPKKHLEYNFLIHVCMDKNNYTPIFEFVSRDNKIVIDYPQSALILTSIRSMDTGEYIDIREFLSQYLSSEIDVVDTVFTNHSNISEFASVVKDLKGEEGVVVKFKSGKFVKIKADEYCAFHKMLDVVKHEKDVLRLVLENKIDDVLPLVSVEMQRRLCTYSQSVLGTIMYHDDYCKDVFIKLYAMTGDNRTRFASYMKEYFSNVEYERYSAQIFKHYSGKETSFKNLVLKRCSSSTDVESVRWLIGTSFHCF